MQVELYLYNSELYKICNSNIDICSYHRWHCNNAKHKASIEGTAQYKCVYGITRYFLKWRKLQDLYIFFTIIPNKESIVILFSNRTGSEMYVWWSYWSKQKFFLLFCQITLVWGIASLLPEAVSWGLGINISYHIQSKIINLLGIHHVITGLQK